jgi:signal transduction histidine kinase
VSDQPVRVNVISADGRMRVVELGIEPRPAGPAEGLVLRLKDITAYHQDVASARAEVRRRDEFLAMLSHELRNPLAAIHGAAGLLARDGVGAAARREAGEIVDRQFKHLARILDDLLDITRISRGKLELKRERVGLAQVVRDATAAAAPQVRKRGHALRVDAPAEEVWVWGDPTRLEQVVVNLLNNAAKFTPPGGAITLAVAAAGAGVEVSVRDTGPGVPADLLPRIFEPFVQGPQPAARAEGGLGIGLTLADTIVRLHGGTITAGPNPDGPGACFTVRLPRRGADPGPAAAPAGAAPGRPLRILVVEDNDDARRMLRQVLTLDGHEVLEAGDGPGGLALVAEQRPDVALVDIGLPGLDGYELARRARRGPHGDRVRLIAVTGYGMPQDVRAARAAGFDGHVIKPLRYPELCRLLEGCRADGAGPGGPAGQ